MCAAVTDFLPSWCDLNGFRNAWSKPHVRECPKTRQ
jgi:hypothetical protein